MIWATWVQSQVASYQRLIYIYIYIWRLLCVYDLTHSIYLSLSVYIYIYIYVCVCVCVCIPVCVCYAFVYNLSLSLNIYIYIYTYMSVCMSSFYSLSPSLCLCLSLNSYIQILYPLFYLNQFIIILFYSYLSINLSIYTPRCSSYWKGSLRSPSTPVKNFTFTYFHSANPAHRHNRYSFRQWSGRPRFNPRSYHTKDSKMVLDTSLLNTQQYKVRIEGKGEQSRERSSTFP